MTNAEHDKDMIESIEMWLHEIEPKWVEKELAWLEELRNRLLEEDTPNDLEEAAKNHFKQEWNEKYWAFEGDVINTFIAGAKWQKEQDEKEQADLFTIVALDVAQRAKEQMMKEAVEGEYDFYPAAVYLDVPIPRMNHGDKVRVIIVKEDGK